MKKPVVKLNKEALDKVQKKLSDAQFAELINVSPATLSRVKSENTLPGETFIAAILKAFPKKRFEHFFFLD